MTRVLGVLLALLAPTGCSGSQAPAPDDDVACDQLDQPADDTLPVPDYLTLPTDHKLLRVQTQGRTTVVFASTAGDRDDLVAVRDRVLAALKKQDFSVVGTDQEPGFEAEAQIAGPSEGTVRVVALCSGRIQVRYKLEG